MADIKRPTNKTLREVIAYLNSINLDVTGQCCDLDAAILYRANQFFDAEEVIRYRKITEADGWTDYEELKG